MTKKWIILLLQVIFIVLVSTQYGGASEKYKSAKFSNENENQQFLIKSNQYRVYALTTPPSPSSPQQSPVIFPDSNYKTHHKHFCFKTPKLPGNSNAKCWPNRCEFVCKAGYQFPNGDTTSTLTCEDGEWIVNNSELNLTPSCEPICMPPCQNHGVCISPGVCECQDQYSGPQCQNQNPVCLTPPPLPKFSRRVCTEQFCTIQCMKGYKFYDGSTMTNLRCNTSGWEAVRPDWQTIPDCEPTCELKCQNGGKCIAANICQCLPEFRGPQCQYLKSACSHTKLNFNGAYKCGFTEELVSCQLHCPPGTTFQHEPAKNYVCRYAEGYFTPRDIPNCSYGDHHYVKTTVMEAKPKKQYKFLNIAIYDFQKDTDFGKVELPGMYVIQDVELVANKKPAVCQTWNGNRFKTFDGLIYDAPLYCSHTLLQDNEKGEFSIVLRACSKKSPQPCSHNLDILIGDLVYSFDSKANGLIFQSDGKEYPIPVQLQGIRVSGLGSILKISIDTPEIDIYWDTKHHLMIEITPALWNRTGGLCGTMDGNLENDFTTKTGESLKKSDTFISTWRASASDTDTNCNDQEIDILDTVQCDPAVKIKAANICKQLLSEQSMRECLKYYDRNAMIAACMGDYCNCFNRNAPEKCVCDGVSSFVKDCKFRGIQLRHDWRNLDICPILCSNDRVYKSCGPSFEPTCGLAAEEKSSGCREGCFCPDKKIQYHGKCVDPQECPCFLRGKTFRPGSEITMDCNTCKCVSGLWKCTDKLCGSRCAIIGDPHYITFDGKQYDFMGKCSYTLLKSDNVSIEVENVACPGYISDSMQMSPYKSLQMPSCTKSVTVDVLDQWKKKQSITMGQGRRMTINEQEVLRLPQQLSNGYIKIVEPSSLFTLVKLQDGIKVWWDGVARLYIDVPARYRGRTQGLCGTFNGNANDDFLTPEGDVEIQADIFADKWRTKETCSLINTQPRSQHPCSINLQNHAKAEKLCSKIRSNLFYECHWTVSPTSYYDDCMFDVCTCENNLDQCACPIIAAYASECARRGIIIEWTPSIAECAIKCPNGQIYDQCGSACSRTCEDIQLNTECDLPCVEGCRCPPNQVLNDRHECIPIALCTCSNEGIAFYNGQSTMKKVNGIFNNCTCTDGDWKCIAIDNTLQNIALKCNENQMFTSCMPNDVFTCGRINLPLVQSDQLTCKPGCICITGYIYDSAKQICVMPENCNCYHGGNIYKEGNSIHQNCNICNCSKGLWQCTEKECDSTCTVWGDSHYETFDGRNFDFQGVCNYILSTGTLPNGDGFLVEIHNSVCGSNGVSCPKSVQISVIGTTPERIMLTPNVIPNNKNGQLEVFKSGVFIIVNSPKLGFKISWDQGRRVYLKLDKMWQDIVKGLCGNYNGNTMDDFKTPSGGQENSATLFGDAWKLDGSCNASTDMMDACSLNPKRKPWAESKCSVLKSDTFRAGHAEVPVDKFYERCVFDTCACDEGGDCECLCTALSAYAQECSNKGIPIKWRMPELCPMQCGSNSYYTSCVSPCALETCQHFLTGTSPNCNEDSCIEGCEIRKCTTGLIYLDDSYNECVESIKCNTSCIRNDNVYLSGDIIFSNECSECRCKLGEIECLTKPCHFTTEFDKQEFEVTLPNISNGVTHTATNCNPNILNTDYPGDCNKFRECAQNTFNEWEYITKTCGENMMYNPKTMVCDWPSSVIAIKPECGLNIVESVTNKKFPILASESKTNCSTGYVYEECAVVCAQTCHHYKQELLKSNMCGTVNCISGCVPKNRICPPDYYHESFETCVPMLNCSCMGEFQKLGVGQIETIEPCSECICTENQRKCSPKTNCLEKLPKCSEPMGLDNGKIRADQIIVSSINPNIPIQLIDQLKLSSSHGWQPNFNTANEFIIFDLLHPHHVTGIKTKGGQSGWVETFNALHYSDQLGWISFENPGEKPNEYLGNIDGTSEKYNKLNLVNPVQYIKIVPTKWYNSIEMKVELLGCFSSAAAEDTPYKCLTCPGVLEENCNCSINTVWNGIACIEKWACPCVDGIKKYPVGESFTATNCSKCFCDLNGISICSPINCLDCENGQLSTISADCQCECGKCPEFSVLCPTTGECILESKWCNGVKDCPDDEINCQTTITLSTTSDAFLTTSKYEDEDEDVELCPKPHCPADYDLEILNGSGDKTSTVFKDNEDLNPPAIDVRTRKTDPNAFNSKLPKPFKMEMAPELNCTDFVCKPKQSASNCKPAKCPEGYELVQKLKNKKRKSGCEKFTCELIPEEDGICEVAGTLINSFDGSIYNYDVCSQVLARDIPNENWMVLNRKNCTNEGCTKSIEIRDKEFEAVLSLHQDLTIQIGNHRYTIDQFRKSQKFRNAFAVSKAGSTLILISPVHGFWVTFNENGDVKLGVNNKNKFKVDGLCGYFDRNPDNDKRRPNGQQVERDQEFGDSWTTVDSTSNLNCKPPQTCSKDHQTKSGHICATIQDDLFNECARNIDMDGYLRKCIESSCNCLNNENSEKTCKCNMLKEFVTECLAGDESIDLDGWRMAEDCEELCPEPLVYKDCYRRQCEPSCDTLDTGSCPFVKGECFPGCYCPDDTVRKEDLCVPASECKDCTCESFGKSQYITFDRNHFTFNGNCTYLLTRDLRVENGPKFEMYVTTAPCEEPEFTTQIVLPFKQQPATCTQSLHIIYDDHIVHIQQNEQKTNLNVLIDGTIVKSLPVKNEWLQISDVLEREIKISLPKCQTEISSMFSDMAFAIQVPSIKYRNKVQGICGNCNKNPFDDPTPISNRNSSILSNKDCVTNELESCIALSPDSDPCLKLMDENLFGKCHFIVEPIGYLSACQQDLCKFGPLQKGACKSVEAYVRECSRNGICLDWRSPNFCPHEECRQGLSYNYCGCPDTCESINRNDIIKIGNDTCGLPKTEGCFCASDHVLRNGECISKEKCHVCDRDGHYPGDIWYPDNCTTCECLTDGQTKCSTKKCLMDDVACVDSFMPQKIKNDDDDCCPKYICVPKPVNEQSDECSIPLLPKCGLDQTRKLIVDKSNCSSYVCECILPEECSTRVTTTSQQPLRPGMKLVSDTTGCCPILAAVCDKTTCPPKLKACADKFYELVTLPIDEKACCDEVKCIPPKDKCIAMVNGEEILKSLGSTWKEMSDPCITKKCLLDNNNGPKEIEIVEECNTECAPGYDYEKIEGNCCGICKTAGCLIGREYHAAGEQWYFNNDNCTKFVCDKIDNSFIIKSIPHECPDVRNCPIAKRIKKGCCMECSVDINGCQVKPMKLEVTKDLIKQFKPDHGVCTNAYVIDGINMCAGACPSGSIFIPETLVQDKYCQCCAMKDSKLFAVKMTCDDGFEYEAEITVPTSCACS